MTLNFAEKTDGGLVNMDTCSCTCARLYVATRTLNHSQNLVPEWGRDGERGEDELWELPIVTPSYLKLSVTQLDRNHGAGVREHRCVMFSLKEIEIKEERCAEKGSGIRGKERRGPDGGFSLHASCCDAGLKRETSRCPRGCHRPRCHCHRPAADT